MKTILGLITILILGIAVIGQKTIPTSSPKPVWANRPAANVGPPVPQPKTPCKLTKDMAPALRKFKLGQDLEEIASWMPRLRAVFEQNKLRHPETAKFGSVLVSSFHTAPDGTSLTSNLPDLDDVEFSLNFMDEKLTYINMKYREFEPDNVRFFLKQVNEKTSLSEEFWLITDPHIAYATCADFDATVSDGKLKESLDCCPSVDSGYPSVTLMDLSANREFRKRRNDAEAKAKALELEKLKAEELKKKTFKP